MNHDLTAENFSRDSVSAAESNQLVNEVPQPSDDTEFAQDGASPDDSSSEPREPASIPYKRFKEVIGERNRLREKLENMQRNPGESAGPYADMYSDDELNTMFRDNPAMAAKTVFSQFMSHVSEMNRIKDRSLGEAIRRYPELSDPNSQVAQMARSILNDEVPDLHNLPQGPAIAAEIAAARYYKDEYQKLAGKHGINLKSLEATRSANLRNAHMEHGSTAPARSYGEALNADEQRVAKLMGVPMTSYAQHKKTEGR